MLSDTPGNIRREYLSDYVVFDLETTGISANYDEIIEISAIRVRNGQPVADFSRLVNPHRKIPAGASAVNGIKNSMVDGEPDMEEILPLFLEFIADDVLVGHNIASFDMRFIYRDARKFFHKIPNNDYLDTLTFARKILPQLSGYKLTDLAAHYHIETQGAHRALNDCNMNQQVFECLGKEPVKTPQADENVILCPKCGQLMKKRKGKFGEFLGCTGYPTCRYTMNV